ncbi:MAG: hypothetical protein KC978_10315 [Candidatus Omnitrophica bacterium]|nr:hypothetical protein [Candidatus Omnitrophota bacterium]
MKIASTNTNTLLVGIVFAAIISMAIMSAWSEEHEHSHKHGDTEKTENPKEVEYLFGNHFCPVGGETVIPESFAQSELEEGDVYGRIYMCCDGCKKKTEEEFEDLYKKFYRTDPKTGKPKDPVDLKNPNCPMSGHPVEDDVLLEYNGMIVHFCCPGCGQDFLEDPDDKLIKLVSEKKDYKYKRPADSGSSKDK